MGTTLVALQVAGGEFELAWVGDSRAYLWTPTREGGRLEQLSVDHSYVQMLVETGVIRPEDAEFHPEKNIITQCLGMQELTQVRVDVVEQQWQKDQWVLLCSDGFVDDESILVLSRVGTKEEIIWCVAC